MARSTEKAFTLREPVRPEGADDLSYAVWGALQKLIYDHEQLVVLEADNGGPAGTQMLREEHFNRLYRMGLGEQNMMALAGGMASTGAIPVVLTQAAFALRAAEQIRLQIAYAKRNVKIIASHAGLDAGPDGAVAQALEDLALFRTIPGLTVISPADALDLEAAMEAALTHDGPVYMRLGRSAEKRTYELPRIFQIGKGHVLREGRDVTIVATGIQVARALDAARTLEETGVRARVVNMATIKPLDTGLLMRCALDTGCFVTAEDHSMYGGLGSAVAETIAASCPCPIEFVAVADRFGQSGEPEQLAERYGLTAPFIAAAAKRAILRKDTLKK